MQTPLHLLRRREGLRQLDISAVMAGLGFKQAAKEGRQRALVEVVAEQAKALARAGLDEGGDQQPIDRPQRFLLADKDVQLRCIAAGWNMVKADAALA